MRKLSFIDYKLLRFLIVGVINTIIGAALMLFFYNIIHLGYWGSSFMANLLASIISYILNKNYTFQNKGSVLKSGIKFALVILICYYIAYGVAKKAVLYIFSMTSMQLNNSIREQIAMLVGMCIFTLLNYLGQRFFAFKNEKD